MSSLPTMIPMELVEKYEKIKSSFYTFYPHTGIWSEGVTATDYEVALESLITNRPDAGIAVYLHFPHCPRQCLFCQCYTVISRDYGKAEKMVDYILREMDLMIDFFNKHSFRPNIKEVHFGGGSPSHLKESDVKRVLNKLNQLVDVRGLDELAIEVDPRFEVDQNRMHFYADCGFTRISFGIQDFDSNVQNAVNRVHSFEDVSDLISPDIRKRFNSFSIDLIYGLPHQTRESFQKTINLVKDLSPDRIALCVLGYRPDVFKFQKTISPDSLPDLEAREQISRDAWTELVENGYERIGIDHFAKPQDDLSIAKKNGTLYRNAMGYTPGRYTEMIGFGPSAMGAIGDLYIQNVYGVEEYYGEIDKKIFSVFRGYKADTDCLIRRDILFSIIHYSKVDYQVIGKKYDIAFTEYFKKELNSLKEIEEDGLLVFKDAGFDLTPTGNRFQRQICIKFDVSAIYKHSRESADLKI
jgi:oxygen-independent coproporphyrinogen III oxidase